MPQHRCVSPSPSLNLSLADEEAPNIYSLCYAGAVDRFERCEDPNRSFKAKILCWIRAVYQNFKFQLEVHSQDEIKLRRGAESLDFVILSKCKPNF